MFQNLLQTIYQNWFHFDSIGSAISAVVDIAIVTFLLYKLFTIIEGTRAVQLIKGLAILMFALVLSSWLQLETFWWILDQIWAVIFVALAVIFQPELRRALEQLGRSRFSVKGIFEQKTEMQEVHNKIVAAMLEEAKTKTGMLLVLEREIGLNNYAESGIPMDCVITKETLVNIFVEKTPLHDGAAIIRHDRILAVACFLPLSDNPNLSSALGTRHRAGIGISEVSDALILMVSEETGVMSAAKEGKIFRNLDEKGVRKHIRNHFSDVYSEDENAKFRLKRVGKKNEKN